MFADFVFIDPEKIWFLPATICLCLQILISGDMKDLMSGKSVSDEIGKLVDLARGTIPIVKTLEPRNIEFEM